MKTPASIGKHPIHPMLVVFPIGLWIFSFISDLIFLLGENLLWNHIAFYAMLGGLIGALLAAVPGLIDMFSITNPEVGKVAWNHMLLNLVALVVFGIDLYLRTVLETDAFIPILLSGFGVLLLAFSGWLGGELAYVHGVGVQQPGQITEKDKKYNKLRRAGER
ncbi:MAG TPA: DUF2231 domain-containing protein [Candidatus Binatia bacterium]|jgi:uncharacterized membrane protein